jgi:prepilin-type N-terminal cleavage/methylation domain-containing protein
MINFLPVSAGQRRRGFTLIELMIVIGIVAIVMGLGVPTLVRVFRKEALRQATADLIEVGSHARALAIQGGQTVELVINPESRTVSVGGGGGGDRPGLVGQNRTSATWPDSLTLEMLDVNFVEYRTEPQARVRFFPNGTCDEATVILRNDANEYRMVFWEVLTGLAIWEADPDNFAKR